MALVLLHVRNDESEISGDQSFRCLLISRLRSTSKPALFFSVGDEGELLDVLEVLVECGGRGRTEKAFRPTLGRCLHSRPGWVVSASAYSGSHHLYWAHSSDGALQKSTATFHAKTICDETAAFTW